MTMIESLLNLFSKYDPEDYTNHELINLISNNLHPFIEEYKTFHLKKESEILLDMKITKLITVRLIASEIWDQIYLQYEENCDYKYRISAIGKLFFRTLVATDENIAMIKNGYGIAVMSNIRLIIESIALSKYIWNAGEIEADRFQDYSMIQSSILFGNKDAERVLRKHEEGFSKEYGWMTKKEFKSIPKILKYTKDDDLYNDYKLTSHFVHASAYSVELLLQQNSKIDHGLIGYFPLGLSKTIELNIKVVRKMSEQIMNWFMNENKELYSFIIKGLNNMK